MVYVLRKFEPKMLVNALEQANRALASQIKPSDESIAKIVIPGWRYDQLAECVLKMYEDANANVMPLDVFSIAISIGCSLMPYRAFGRQIHDILLQASEDAISVQAFGASKPIILFNDRQPAKRINFSIMHELGHHYAGHQEPSHLAEKEANYFAGLALCPVDLLSHYGIRDAKTVSELFNVSNEMAANRIKALQRRRGIVPSAVEQKFKCAVTERFHFKKTYQMELFSQFMGSGESDDTTGTL